MAKQPVLHNPLRLPLSLDSVLPSPLSSRRLIPRAISLVHMRDLRDQGIVGVRVRQH